MKVLEVMERAGGVLEAGPLVRATSRRKVRSALRRGVIVREAKGKYALPTAQEARRAAHRLSGVMTGKSAAAHYGWPMKTQPARPEIAVPRNRKVDPGRRVGVDLRWRDIPEADVAAGVLRPGPAVIDCARRLPFDEALAIADSAVRAGDVTQAELLRLAEKVPSTGRAQALRVARCVDGRAANPFESVLRAIALEVRGLDLEPQVDIVEERFLGRPDLVDQSRRLVLEAESFEFHGRRWMLDRDCVRCNGFVLAGWRVLRFSWENVMLHPSYVRACLEAAVLLPPPVRPRRRAALPDPGRAAA